MKELDVGDRCARCVCQRTSHCFVRVKNTCQPDQGQSGSVFPAHVLRLLDYNAGLCVYYSNILKCATSECESNTKDLLNMLPP